MAVDITQIFEKNLDCFCLDPQFKAYIAKEGDPFEFKSVHYVRTIEESKRLNDLPGPMIIISASGMCEGGRILHHLRNNIDKKNVTILLVGYQAEGTLGCRLQEGAKKVKIFGLEHEVWARVQTVNALSSHADKNDLVNFIQALQPRPRRIFLVHGDPEERSALAEHLKSLGINQIEQPEFENSFELD
jgi:metallo-beta-lactamase family protein